MTKMGLIETIGALIFAIGAAWVLGRRSGAAKKDAEHGSDYIAERNRQDDLDVGHGASDAERVRMLNDIANRNGSRKN